MIRVGIIGCGGMANSHAKWFKSIKGCRLTACSDIVAGRAEAFAQKHEIPAAYEDAAAMLKREELDGVSIVTTDRAHAPMALMAIRHGVNVMCEKPLADTLPAARRMAAAAKAKGVLTAVNFSYRNNPATQEAARQVASGKLGRILHVEGCYLQAWLVSPAWGDWRKSEALLWRLSTRHGSAGVLGDIGVHLYDLASFVVGDIAEIACELKTFDKGKRGIGPYVFDANDSALALVRFRNGAAGALHKRLLDRVCVRKCDPHLYGVCQDWRIIPNLAKGPAFQIEQVDNRWLSNGSLNGNSITSALLEGQ